MLTIIKLLELVVREASRVEVLGIVDRRHLDLAISYVRQVQTVLGVDAPEEGK
jgi:hypothetical protein